jgi:hypothetical protein
VIPAKSFDDAQQLFDMAYRKLQDEGWLMILSNRGEHSEVSPEKFDYEGTASGDRKSARR